MHKFKSLEEFSTSNSQYGNNDLNAFRACLLQKLVFVRALCRVGNFWQLVSKQVHANSTASAFAHFVPHSHSSSPNPKHDHGARRTATAQTTTSSPPSDSEIPYSGRVFGVVWLVSSTRAAHFSSRQFRVSVRRAVSCLVACCSSCPVPPPSISINKNSHSNTVSPDVSPTATPQLPEPSSASVAQGRDTPQGLVACWSATVVVSREHLFKLVIFNLVG